MSTVLPSRGPFDGHLRPGARPAVVAIDMMRAYFAQESPLCLPNHDVLDVATQVIAAARTASIPVVQTRVEYTAGGVDGGVFFRKVPALRHLVTGSPLTQFVNEVEPVDGEVIVTKQYASAFFGSSLSSTLTAMSIDTVIILGVSTSGCVRATAVDACQLGFVPLVVRQGVADRTREQHDSNLYDLQAKYSEVMDDYAVIEFLEAR